MMSLSDYRGYVMHNHVVTDTKMANPVYPEMRVKESVRKLMDLCERKGEPWALQEIRIIFGELLTQSDNKSSGSDVIETGGSK